MKNGAWEGNAMSTLFVIMNHGLHDVQTADAQKTFSINRIVEMPENLAEVWRNVPPQEDEIASFLKPVKEWLSTHAKPGDYILIHGDPGASYLMVNFAFENRLRPIYSTSYRNADETRLPDGTTVVRHIVKQERFRFYGR
jgi:hypothetical protein